jgi:predicted RNA-binding Zn-ribbon protein involved in translation (DUF1610 family)
MEPTNTETDNGFIPNEDAASETSNMEACPKCGKLFKRGPSLRMHEIRKHGRGWSTAGNFGGRTAMTREERLRKRRIYNRKWRLKRGMGVRPKAYRGGNKGMKLPKWSPSRLAKFRRTMREKEMAKSPDKGFERHPEIIAPRATVLCCPRCGLNIEVVRKAMEFADRA